MRREFDFETKRQRTSWKKVSLINRQNKCRRRIALKRSFPIHSIIFKVELLENATGNKNNHSSCQNLASQNCLQYSFASTLISGKHVKTKQLLIPKWRTMRSQTTRAGSRNFTSEGNALSHIFAFYSQDLDHRQQRSKWPQKKMHSTEGNLSIVRQVWPTWNSIFT